MDETTRLSAPFVPSNPAHAPLFVAFGATDRGPVRQNNEDAFAYDLDLGLFIVADGMGGHAAGDIASRLAVETILAFVARSNEDEEEPGLFADVDDSLSPTAARLRTALQLANRRINRASASNAAYRGMGTTVVAVLFSSSSVVVAHAGDSRVYEQHDGRLTQLTTDDSLLELLTAMNAPEAQRANVQRNVVTNVLGGDEEIIVHVSERPCLPGTRLMLCTDGVHGVLDGGRIGGILASRDTPKQHAERLVSEALAAGSRDNATALVVAYKEAV